MSLQTKVLPCLDDSGKVINVANRDGETVLGWLLKNLLVGKMTVANVQEWLGTLKGRWAPAPAMTWHVHTHALTLHSACIAMHTRCTLCHA